MDAFDLRVGRVARRDDLTEQVAREQPRRYRFNALRPLRVGDAAEVIAVERVGYELQPECFAVRQGSAAALLTVA
ncbi:MAG: hypothetical protein WA814_11940 [Candidatus Baltobacteraceae bacterium]